MTTITRADGSTEIANIKSCTFTEKVNSATDLRPGCVSSACIEVVCYGSVSDAPEQGEALTYYQTDTSGNSTLIGIFYAEPAITSKKTYSFTAYDAAAKLDVDFSETLAELTFPTTVYSIVASACSVAGVRLASSSWALSTQAVQEFYSEGVTCRNILEWAAEIACCFVRCNTSGALVFDWYAEAEKAIYPTSGLNLVPYKSDGLTYENYQVRRIASVAVRPVESDGIAYVYPDSYDAVYATDSGNIGNIVLYNIAASASSGNITISDGDFDVYDDGLGNLSIVAWADESNSLVIANNLLLTNASAADMMAVAENIFTVMRTLPVWRPMSANLFSFNNPFRAGNIISVTDSQDVSFTTLIMSNRISTSDASVQSTANERNDNSSYTGDSGKILQQLNARYTQLVGDVVFVSDLTDGTTVISGDNILTGTIDASVVSVANLNASNITSGTLLARFIKLFGFMTVYKIASSSTSGGNIGFFTGSSDIGDGIAIMSDPVYDASGYYGGVVAAGQEALFLGYTPGGSWHDGGVDVNSGNYSINIRLSENGIEVYSGGVDENLTSEEVNARFTTGTSGSESLRPVNILNGFTKMLGTVTINGRDLESEMGTLSSLTTTDKTSIVAAINELESRIAALGG